MFLKGFLIRALVHDVAVVQATAVFVLLFGIIVVTAVCANVLVVMVIASSRHLRTVTNVFFVSLAVSDLLVAGVNVPLQMINHAHNQWTLGQTLCKISHYVQGVVFVSSILTLTGIAVDRRASCTSTLRYVARL